MKTQIIPSTGRRLRHAFVHLALAGYVFGGVAQLHAGTPQQDDYRVAAEDVIAITVVGVPKFSGEYAVPNTGKITMPVVGELSVGGLTLLQIRDAVVVHLEKRLVRPEVIVSLKAARPQRFFVFGDIKTAGVLELRPGWGVVEALSAAGGLATGVLSSDVTVTYEPNGTSERRLIPLDKALAATGKDRIVLSAGDVLRFEAIQPVPIYVSGNVKTPGLYRLRPQEAGILEALTQAGGALPDTDLRKVRIVRLGGGEETVDVNKLVNGTATNKPKLQGGDMIIVSASEERFVILGFVQKPGYYTVPNGEEYTLSEAVALAQGPAARARLSRVGLLRTEGGKEIRSVIDLGKFFKTGDAALNPKIKAGDVIYIPESDGLDGRTILTGLSTAAIVFRAIGR